MPGRTEVLEENLSQCRFCPSQIPHGLDWDSNRVLTVSAATNRLIHVTVKQNTYVSPEGRESSVGIATRYGLVGSGIECL